MFNVNAPIIVLAPHTDDGEFGCGGTLAKLIESHSEVYYVAFSSCEASVPEGLPKDCLKHEVRNAVRILGIKPANLILLEFPVRYFPENRQPILEEMVKLQKEICPSLVFLPSTNDTHQDHNVISQEGFRAFKKCTILGYEVPWNNLSFHTNCFVPLSKQHIESKCNALKCYESQSFRSYANEEFVKSLATVRGTQIGTKYAEAFETIRWIMS